jgi:hypothetical protein
MIARLPEPGFAVLSAILKFGLHEVYSISIQKHGG